MHPANVSSPGTPISITEGAYRGPTETASKLLEGRHIFLLNKTNAAYKITSIFTHCALKISPSDLFHAKLTKNEVNLTLNSIKVTFIKDASGDWVCQTGSQTLSKGEALSFSQEVEETIDLIKSIFQETHPLSGVADPVQDREEALLSNQHQTPDPFSQESAKKRASPLSSPLKNTLEIDQNEEVVRLREKIAKIENASSIDQSELDALRKQLEALTQSLLSRNIDQLETEEKLRVLQEQVDSSSKNLDRLLQEAEELL